MRFHGYAAVAPGKPLEPFSYDPGLLRPDEVQIVVESCGICHSDLSMADNEWGITQYPFIPGHEVVGRIESVGSEVFHLQVGQRVGLGWRSRSCLACLPCLDGQQNLCQTHARTADTIVGRHGGFADRVRCQAVWAIPLPEGVDPLSAGPLFCGGITVFNPILIHGIRSTDRVAVVGIGGLGHMALGFLRAWGCEVTAFSTSPTKEAEARALGAHHFLNTRDPKALAAAAGRFDMVLVTVNHPLDWDAYVSTLAPGGKLHIVGAIPKLEATWFPFLAGQRSASGSPIGGPAAMMRMVDFADRHQLKPLIEVFPMNQVNEALDHLRTGSPRYRIVLTNA